jgi:hypothetical protein
LLLPCRPVLTYQCAAIRRRARRATPRRTRTYDVRFALDGCERERNRTSFPGARIGLFRIALESTRIGRENRDQSVTFRPDGSPADSCVQLYDCEGVGSSGWIRTSNPPVNRRTQVFGLAGFRAGSSGETMVLRGVRQKIGQRLSRPPTELDCPPATTSGPRPLFLHTRRQTWQGGRATYRPKASLN